MHALHALDAIITLAILAGTIACVRWLLPLATVDLTTITLEQAKQRGLPWEVYQFLVKHHYWYFPCLMASVGLITTGLLMLSLLWAGIAELACGFFLLMFQMYLWRRVYA